MSVLSSFPRRRALGALFVAAGIGVVLVARDRRAALRSVPALPSVEAPAPSIAEPPIVSSSIASSSIASSSIASSSIAEAPSSIASPPRPQLPPLTRVDLDTSLALGRAYLLQAQRPEGNFTYVYDWTTRTVGNGDNPVRQAGAAWALALIHREQPTPETAAAVARALGYLERHSHVTPEGRRYVVYPGEVEGQLGIVALTALTHLTLLGAGPSRPRLREHLDQYLAMILDALGPDGRFVDAYDLDDGIVLGSPDPYYEGEALLALVTAARSLGRDDLRAPALLAADKGHEANVVQALAKDPRSKTTRAYFQWSLLAYHALATSGWPDTERYGAWALELADWMIDVHGVGEGTSNDGYALEGLAVALDLARLRKDERRVAKIRAVVLQDLARLTGFQVGHPRASPFTASAPLGDPRARGGVQGQETSGKLRIDVTQHQMHALLLAQRYLPVE